MTVSMMFPISTERVVLVARRQRVAIGQEQNNFSEFGEILAAPLSKFHIALELGAAIQFAHA